MCGVGVRERLVVCAEESNGARHRVPDDACSSMRPKVQESCNTHECPKWQVTEWSGVSQSNLISIREKICLPTNLGAQLGEVC